MTDDEIKNLEANHKLLKWWGDKLEKMSFDIRKSIFHRNNLKATLWIIAFNPLTWPLYIVLILVIIFGLTLL